jgi:TusA-related sulfurtransferase
MLSEDSKSQTQFAPTIGVEEATCEDFLVALSDRSTERLEACFHPEVRMRALVPSGYQEHKGPAAVAARLSYWFAKPDTLELLQKNVYRVADRLHIRYRFRERYSDGESRVIEQDAYCDLREGHIVAIDLLCSGHRQEPGNNAARVHHFDAGDLGCSSGLPEEFRRQIDSIPAGSILEVSTRDPSAKEDLPSLTRLLGHRVVSISKSPEGNTVLTVQRVH